MHSLPPPAHNDDDQMDDPCDPSASGRLSPHRRKYVITAIVATGLGIGATAVGSQFASAAPDGTSADRAEPASDPDEGGSDTEGRDTDHDAEDLDTEDLDDATSGTPTADESPGFDGPPFGEFGEEVEAAFEEFDACLADQLPDIVADGVTTEIGAVWENGDWADGDWKDGDWKDGDWADHAGGDVDMDGFVMGGLGEFVTVFDDEGASHIDFGDGDGSVTITKQEGTISVVTDGDVEQIDLPELIEWDGPGGEFPGLGPFGGPDGFGSEIEAAHEACADALPDFANVESGPWGGVEVQVDAGESED